VEPATIEEETTTVT